MCKFLDCLKEEYRFLTNGEQKSYFSRVAILATLIICMARFVHNFIKSITKRENRG